MKIKYSNLFERAIPLLANHQYSCDVIDIVLRGLPYHDVGGWQSRHLKIIKKLEDDFGLFCGYHDFASFETPDDDTGFTLPTPESQQARALWLTFAGLVWDEAGHVYDTNDGPFSGPLTPMAV